jgi:GNAT superfamily N-acetyltransferase
VAGSPTHYSGALVQAIDDPGEPMGFGDDAAALWQLLQAVKGWFCVEVTRECARTLGPLIERGLDRRVRYYDDVYYTLAKPAVPVAHPSVRMLTLDELGMLDAMPRAVRPGGFGSTQALLAEGIVAAAIVEGQVVATAHTSARTPRHADIGVATQPEWRGHGFATAAAALVARAVQQAGQTPVWSTGEDNVASQRVAQKVGFAEIGRRAYVIVDDLRP